MQKILKKYPGVCHTKVDEKIWIKGRDLALLLGYKSPSVTVSAHVPTDGKKTLRELNYTTISDCPHNTIFVNELGAKHLIMTSRMPKALDMAEMFGIDVYSSMTTRKEQDSMKSVMEAFEDEKMVYQHTVGKYRIDLYFSDYKIAVECDENGHRDRNTQEENKRQEYLERKLQCEFVRYNPDSPTFNINVVVNKIFKIMKYQLLRK